ncbi:MAG: hypothetical protein M3N52_06800 [Actinomycetota bacterium]|nr:hypothetical protein [Actinomycetota bacterium]
MLRLAERDPFAGLPTTPNRPPRSGSIRDAQLVARRMDGADLRVCLLGVHAVVIGTPGTGKSQTLRTLADAVSACADALVWDLDPSGAGSTHSAAASPAGNATPPGSKTRSPMPRSAWAC